MLRGLEVGERGNKVCTVATGEGKLCSVVRGTEGQMATHMLIDHKDVPVAEQTFETEKRSAVVPDISGRDLRG